MDTLQVISCSVSHASLGPTAWFSLSEATGVTGLAFALAFIVTIFLRGKSNGAKNKMKMEGKLGSLKWIYTGEGQVVVFIVVFLVVVACYIALRLAPST